MTTDDRILVRRTLIDLARRRERRGTGSAASFLRRRTTVMAWPDLTGVLSPLPWAVVGAAATRLYMPERATRDLDVAVRAGDARDVRDRLSRAGFTQLGELSIGGSSWRATDGAEIDVIEGREEWWDDALREAQANRDASGLPILPLRHLVLMKLRSGRVQDIADVARMLGQADPGALDAVRALFRRYAPADLGDLESLAALGRLETEEPREPAI